MCKLVQGEFPLYESSNSIKGSFTIYILPAVRTRTEEIPLLESSSPVIAFSRI